jgi:RNAse (barnase) inhibitor barstar
MNYKYLENGVDNIFKDNFFVHVDPRIASKEDLFNFYYHAMWFPGYFGFNLDALYDFLCDLSWINKRKIIILHDKIPGMNEVDMRKYLSLLNDVCAIWSDKANSEHEIQIYFNYKDKEIIEELIE